MSIIDPNASRPQAPAASRGSVWRTLSTVALVVAVAGGLLAGFGFGSISAVIDERASFWLPVLAIPGVLCAGIAAIGDSIMSTMNRGWGAVLAQGAAELAAGIGAIASGVVFGVSPVPIVVGAVLCLVGGAFVTLSLTNRRRRLRERTAVAEVRRSGRETTAVVTDQGWTRFHESSRLATTVTFRFVDDAGMTRWVQRFVAMHESDPLRNGQTTRLWFDPAAPDDDRRIIVEAAVARPLFGPGRLLPDGRRAGG